MCLGVCMCVCVCACVRMCDYLIQWICFKRFQYAYVLPYQVLLSWFKYVIVKRSGLVVHEIVCAIVKLPLLLLLFSVNFDAFLQTTGI